MMSNNQIHNTISDLIREGKWDDLIEFCERQEIINEQSNWHSIVMMAHVMKDDLSSARIVWKRFYAAKNRQNSQISPQCCAQTEAVWSIVKKLIAKKYASLRAPQELHDWDGLHADLISKFTENFRSTLTTLISNVYSSIHLKNFQNFLGLDEQSAIKYLNWRLDGDYVITSNNVIQDDDKNILNSLDLVSSVMCLESE